MDRDEVLARVAKDPVFFGAAFLEWRAHPGQVAWLRGSTCKQNWNRAGNRWGKTESIAIKHLWMCTFKIRGVPCDWDAPYVTLNSSISMDQAKIPLEKAWNLIHRKGGELYRRAFVRRRVETPFPRIEFMNGSTWWCRSTTRKGRYLHGHDYDYVSNDEGGEDPCLGYIIDEVLQMRLLDRSGRMDCISTGKRGSEFNRRFDAARLDPGMFAYQGNTLDNPYIDRTALDLVIERLDAGLVEERIYGGERPSDGRIPNDSIERAVAQSVGLSPPERGHRYSTGWDIAKTRHYTVGLTLDVTSEPYQVVAWERFNAGTVGLEGRSYWEHLYARVRLRHRLYGGITRIDATGLGIVVGDNLRDIGVEAVTFTGPGVREMMTLLEMAFGLGVVGVPPLEAVNQDGSRWTLRNELEEIADDLSGLDTAASLALALGAVRDALMSRATASLGSKVVGLRGRR